MEREGYLPVKNTMAAPGGRDVARYIARKRQLSTLQLAGSINGLELFPKVYLTEAHVRHVLTFKYYERGTAIYERLKSGTDPRHKDLVKLWPVYGKGTLRLTAFRRGDFVIVREIEMSTEEG